MYLHYTRYEKMSGVERKWPAIRNWTIKLFEEREQKQIMDGGFGNLETLDDENEESINENEKKVNFIYIRN